MGEKETDEEVASIKTKRSKTSGRARSTSSRNTIKKISNILGRIILSLSLLYGITNVIVRWQTIKPILFPFREFSKAEKNEILIIVSPPYSIREKKIELNYHHLIANDIYHHVIKNMLIHNFDENYVIRIGVLEKETIEYENKAVEIADKYKATLVIGSMIDKMGITNSVLIRDPVIGSDLPKKHYVVYGNVIRFDNDNVLETLLSDGILQTRYLVKHSIGLIHYYRREYQSAINFFEFALDSLTKNIDPSPTYLLLGDSYLKQNPLDTTSATRAIAKYQRITELNLDTYISQAYQSMGYCYFSIIKDYDAAISCYSKAIEHSYDPRMYELRGRAYYEKSLSESKRKNYEVVISLLDLAKLDFERAILLAPSNRSFVSDMLCNIGNISYSKYGEDSAAVKYKEAIQYYPNNYAFFNLVEIYCRKGQFGTAKEYYRRMTDRKLKKTASSEIMRVLDNRKMEK